MLCVKVFLCPKDTTWQNYTGKEGTSKIHTGKEDFIRYSSRERDWAELY